MYKIVRVDFPFMDKNIVKSRPCLVLSKPKGKHKLVVIAYITSKNTKIEDTDVEILENSTEFLETGLTKNSVIKLHRLEHISALDIQGIVGEVGKTTETKIKSNLKKLFNL